MYRRFLVAGLAKWIVETTATATSPNLRSVKPTSADLLGSPKATSGAARQTEVEPLLASIGCCLVHN